MSYSLPDLYICDATYVAQEDGDLTINGGDIIVAIGKVNEHWMQGQVCYDSKNDSWPKLIATSQTGTFPLNHCSLLNSEQVEALCHDSTFKSELIAFISQRQQPKQNVNSLSNSSGSSSLQSSTDTRLNSSQPQFFNSKQPPPRPQQQPKQMFARASHQVIDHKDHQQLSQSQPQQLPPRSTSMLSIRQQDKLKGWLNTVRKKTARLSTRITASLGLISLTRDEKFEELYQEFKLIEKTIRVFIKNLSAFVEHFENFLIALQNTSENLSDFYRDKSHQKEINELRRKNKALACEHFHAFKRTVDKQVILVAQQLLQKFSGPQQLISKRSAKLLDYDTRTKEMQSCKDLTKKNALRENYVIAKDLYDTINKQLIDELPIFNKISLDIFKECILVLLDSRRNLINSYTNQTASLLDTPLMMTYTASDVASSILMSCDLIRDSQVKRNHEINEIIEQERKDSGQTSGHDTRHNSANDDEPSRPQSPASGLSSEFNNLAFATSEICSTPLSKAKKNQENDAEASEPPEIIGYDQPDGPPVGLIELNENAEARVEGKASDMSKADRSKNGSVNKKSLNLKERKKRKCQIYVASWPFVATGPNQLTIACKQPLKLIKGCDESGNSDWCLVQDKKGQLGYVPSSYIKKKD